MPPLRQGGGGARRLYRRSAGIAVQAIVMLRTQYEGLMKASGNLNEPLRVGDRCRLSDLGRMRNPRRGIGLCEVISFGISSQRIRIRFVGYRSVHTMHASYLERVPDTPEGRPDESDSRRPSTASDRSWATALPYLSRFWVCLVSNVPPLHGISAPTSLYHDHRQYRGIESGAAVGWALTT